MIWPVQILRQVAEELSTLRSPLVFTVQTRGVDRAPTDDLGSPVEHTFVHGLFVGSPSLGPTQTMLLSLAHPMVNPWPVSVSWSSNYVSMDSADRLKNQLMRCLVDTNIKNLVSALLSQA